MDPSLQPQLTSDTSKTGSTESNEHEQEPNNIMPDVNPSAQQLEESEDDHIIRESAEPLSNDDFLTIVGQQHGNSSLLEVIKHNYKEDPFFSRVLETPKVFRNFTQQDKLLYIQDWGRHLLCVLSKVMFKGQRLGEIFIAEAHSLLAHLGASKTSIYLKDHV